MEIFRYGHDVFGEPIIDGLSWNLLGVAVAIGIAVIGIHFVMRAFSAKRR
jgi:hypothetical protein